MRLICCAKWNYKRAPPKDGEDGRRVAFQSSGNPVLRCQGCVPRSDRDGEKIDQSGDRQMEFGPQRTQNSNPDTTPFLGDLHCGSPNGRWQGSMGTQ